MPPFQAADELREAMAVLKKSDHLGDWDGGQGEGEGEDVREGQAGHRPEASESQEERSSNKRKITSPGETQKRKRSEAGVEKGVSAAVEDETVLTPSVAHARDSGGASAAQQAQGPHDAVQAVLDLPRSANRGGGSSGSAWARLEFGDGLHVPVCTALGADFCIGGYRETNDEMRRQYAAHYHSVHLEPKP
jgi:hypothetical protein